MMTFWNPHRHMHEMIVGHWLLSWTM